MSDNRSRWAWFGFPGPVFGRELRSAARSRWFYLVRAVAACLAGYVGFSVPFREALAVAGDWSPGRVAELASRAFRTFEAAQFVGILALTPLLVAGSVAEEKVRGTLGLVLAARLGSLEIVAGKLAARSLAILVLMATGLPVLAMIGLLGGVDPVELGLAYGLTLTSAWFAASLSILVSVHARTVVGAVIGAYAAGLAWLFLPAWIAAWIASPVAPVSFARLVPIARELALFTPVSYAYALEIWGPTAMGPMGWIKILPEMATLQAAGGLALLALAAWRLRPAYRAQVGGSRSTRRRFARLARWAGLGPRPMPPCGDDPMGWKERYAPESAWLARLALLIGVGLVARSIRFQFFGHPSFLGGVFDETFTHGLRIGEWGAFGVQRAGLNSVLCEHAAILFTAALAASTILAASGIAGERGRGTWSGLLATPLDRREILRAKTWGAVRPVRWLLGMMLVLYLASVASTAMHPVGLAMVVLGVSAFLWFAVALGSYVSARSKGAGQAIGRSVVILAGINLVPVAALFPVLGPSSFLVSTPGLLTFLPFSRTHFRGLTRMLVISPTEVLPFLVPLGIVLAHAIGAWALTRATARRIERDEG